MIKKVFFVLIVSISSLNSFSQIYGVGNSDGYAFSCITWVNLEIIPVNLTGFFTECAADKVTINWTVTSADKGDAFYIEKSNDGAHFETAAYIPVREPVFSHFQYSFDDRKPLLGPAYYRLRITGMYGEQKYSQVSSVNCRFKTGAETGIYPNPSSGIINIYPASKIFSIVIRNTAGQQVFYKSNCDNPLINLSHLPTGLYFAEIRMADKLSVHKLILGK